MPTEGQILVEDLLVQMHRKHGNTPNRKPLRCLRVARWDAVMAYYKTLINGKIMNQEECITALWEAAYLGRLRTAGMSITLAASTMAKIFGKTRPIESEEHAITAADKTLLDRGMIPPRANSIP